MSFWSNLVLAVMSAVNPVLGFVGSVIKYITSSAQAAGTVLMMELAGMALPGGLAKDIAAGVISDAFETGLGGAADAVVPINDVALECEACGQYSRYYVKDSGYIRCRSCFRDHLEPQVPHDGRLYVIRGGVYRLAEERKSISLVSRGRGFDRSSGGGFSRQ